jgi:RNA polymerase sigma factor (sigma-70 family)
MFFRRSAKKVIKDDEELLILYKESGDMVYLGELYERHVHLVFGTCMKYLKNKDDSKDMSMQVFEKLRVELRKQEVKNFTSWLHVLTKNQCLMLLRSAKYKLSRNFDEINDSSDVEFGIPMHHVESEELEMNLQQLEKAVEGLPEEQKICIHLFYLEEKSYKEIVDVTGYDLNKVKSYIQNGKRNLKIHLQRINEQP